MAFPKKSKRQGQADRADEQAYQAQLHGVRENAPEPQESEMPSQPQAQHETQITSDQVSHEPKPSSKRRKNNSSHPFVRKNA